MGVVTIGMTGSGSIGDNETWSVTDAATPISIGSRDGSTGAVHMSAKSTSLSKFITNNDITITDTELGTVEAVIETVNINGGSVDFDALPILTLLSADRVSPPTGSQALSSIFDAYVALVTDQITVSYEATSDPVRLYGGWEGNVWTYLMALCAANNVEIAASGSVMTVRDVGSRTLTLDDNQEVSLSLSTEAAGRSVDIVYHNYELITIGALVYNYSQNPSLEANATNWSTVKNAFGTITSGRAT